MFLSPFSNRPNSILKGPSWLDLSRYVRRMTAWWMDGCYSLASYIIYNSVYFLNESWSSRLLYSIEAIISTNVIHHRVGAIVDPRQRAMDINYEWNCWHQMQKLVQNVLAMNHDFFLFLKISSPRLPVICKLFGHTFSSWYLFIRSCCLGWLYVFSSFPCPQHLACPQPL